MDNAAIRCATAIVGLLLLSACYTYAEAPLSSLAPGIQTRVRLDQDGFGRVVNLSALNGVAVDNMDMTGRGVVGRLLSLGPSNMVVELRGAGGNVFSADIQMQAVQEVAVRSFSRRRTIGAVAAGAALAALVYTGTTGGTTTAPGPPEPDNFTVPLFSIRIP